MEDEDDIEGLPGIVRRTLDHLRSTSDPYQYVWQRVVRRLVQDAFGNTGHSDANDHDRAMREARMWFRHHPVDVEMVFDLAGASDWRGVRREVIRHEPSYKYDDQTGS